MPKNSSEAPLSEGHSKLPWVGNNDAPWLRAIKRVRDFLHLDRIALIKQRDTLGTQLSKLNERTTARIMELTRELQQAGLGATTHTGDTQSHASSRDEPAPTKGQPAGAGQERTKFIIFSNPRSGSTWLQTTLGLLPGVFVDFEMKWKPLYDTSDLHFALDHSEQTASEFLATRGGDSAAVGSKFVFDPTGLTPSDFDAVLGRLGPDIRIIHLTRNYRDVFLSICRGFYHAPNMVRRGGISDRLSSAIERAEQPKSTLSQAISTPAMVIGTAACDMQLDILLYDDLLVQSARRRGFAYLRVDYADVKDSLGEIVRFLGLEIPDAKIAEVLANPAVSKLPSVSPHDIVSNWDDLAPLFKTYENLRQTRVLEKA